MPVSRSGGDDVLQAEQANTQTAEEEQTDRL